MEGRIQELEQRFRTIGEERMQGLPFLHTGLEVEAVGFARCERGLIGALITPWALNLVYLPGLDEAIRPGSTRVLEFPAGNFSFIDSWDEELGPLATCSIFSGVTDLVDQEAAREAARAVMETLMKPSVERGAKAAGNSISRRDFLRGAVSPGRAT